MEWLQEDRVSTALNYWNSLGILKDETIWYLSGGVKKEIEKFSRVYVTKSNEAERMGESFSDFFGDQVVLDTSATNTAENFRNFFTFISTLNLIQEYEIVVVTSAFHKKRAEKFFYGFFPQSIYPKWVLAPLACETCYSDELYHMRNVESDIAKAKTIGQSLSFDL